MALGPKIHLEESLLGILGGFRGLATKQPRNRMVPQTKCLKRPVMSVGALRLPSSPVHIFLHGKGTDHPRLPRGF